MAEARRWRSLVRVAGLAASLGAFAAGALAARGPLAAAASSLSWQRPLPLALAAFCALLVPLATAAAWRSALHSRLERLSFREAWGCYGIGSLANSVLPGGAGEAVRIESFARRLATPKRRILACGTSATIAIGQTVVLATLLASGAIGGALPLWTLAPAVGLPAGLALARALSHRRATGRLGRITAAADISSSSWLRLFAWLIGSAMLRLLAVTAVLDAVAAPHP